MPPATSSSATVHLATRRRRWWQLHLSLRALMILVVVIGAPLGWLARRAAIQRRAVATVQVLGGSVHYEDEIDPQGRPRLPHRPWGPVWLRRWIGDEFFQEVAWVLFDARRGGPTVDDDTIAVLKSFDRLQGITLDGANPTNGQKPPRHITAAGLASLESLRRLRVLHLYRVQTDAAMVALLPRWPSLEDINIHDDAPTLPGSCLRVLGQLPRLQDVAINSIESSTAADLAPLASLPNLRRVIINRSPLDATGLEAFAIKPRLELLNLEATPLGEPFLKFLTGGSQLQALSFDGTQLRSGLRPLAGLEQFSIGCST